MKILTSKKSIKIISLLLAVTILTFSVCPNVVYADTGGKLFKPIFQLLATVGDLIMEGLQKIFIGVGDIRIETAGSVDDYDLYSIRYGPGVIFSNIVPDLDANFINPKYTKSNPYEITTTSGFVYNKTYTDELKKYKSMWQSGNATVDDIVDVMGKVLGTTVDTSGLKIVVIADSSVNDETEILFYYDYNQVTHCFSLRDGNNDWQEGFYYLINQKVANNETATGEYTYSSFLTLLNGTAVTDEGDTYSGTKLFSEFCRRLPE